MFIYIVTSESISIIGEEVKNHQLAIILQVSSVTSAISQAPHIIIYIGQIVSITLSYWI